MQIRCSYCQTMIAIRRDEILAALQHMAQHDQKYYDAHCPKCRRANRVEGKRLALFIPDWKKTVSEMQKAADPAQKTGIKTEIKAESASKKSANKETGKVVSQAKPAPAKPAPAKPAPAGKPSAKAGGKIKAK